MNRLGVVGPTESVAPVSHTRLVVRPLLSAVTLRCPAPILALRQQKEPES